MREYSYRHHRLVILCLVIISRLIAEWIWAAYPAVSVASVGVLAVDDVWKVLRAVSSEARDNRRQPERLIGKVALDAAALLRAGRELGAWRDQP